MDVQTDRLLTEQVKKYMDIFGRKEQTNLQRFVAIANDTYFWGKMLQIYKLSEEQLKQWRQQFQKNIEVHAGQKVLAVPKPVSISSSLDSSDLSQGGKKGGSKQEEFDNKILMANQKLKQDVMKSYENQPEQKRTIESFRVQIKCHEDELQQVKLLLMQIGVSCITKQKE